MRASPGAGASRATTCRSTSRCAATRDRHDAELLRRQSRRGAEGAEARACACSRAEEDEARKLLGTARRGAAQASRSIDARTYGDIVTGAKERVAPLENRGLEARAMTAPQRAQLRKLIEVYADDFEPGLRAARLARVDDGPLRGRALRVGRRYRARPAALLPRAGRRSSSSSTTPRRTTATTSTRCGATSTATSGATCFATITSVDARHSRTATDDT